MLYRFKSRETADLIMLEAHAVELLRLLGKDPSGPGILVWQDLPAAVLALQQAVARAEELARQQERPDDPSQTDDQAGSPHVSLRQRLAPIIQMMQRSATAECDIVWGV